MNLKTTLLCSVFALAASSATGALAQTAAAPGAAAENSTIEEVVVTARKREESLQNIPVAVSAISGENLARQGIRQVGDLTRSVPSLNIQSNVSQTGTGIVVALRGQQASDVLLSQSQPVGLYEDSVNIPHPVGANIAFFDLQRVEVLKGPQGTLYGRNTTGGAINILTRGADYSGYHGFVYGEAGNYKDWKVGTAVNLPIVPDMLAARIAYQHWSRQGYGQSAVTGQHLGGDRDDDIARVSLKIDPTPTVSATLKAEYFQANRAGNLFQTAYLYNPAVTDAEWAAEGKPGGVAPSVLVGRSGSDLFTNYQEANTHEKLTGWHGAFDLSWDITDYVRLRSITGVHQFTDRRSFDLDGLPLQAWEVGLGQGGIAPVVGTESRNVPPDQQSKQWTQEFNLSGAAFEKRLNWMVGAFAASDKASGDQIASIYPAALIAQGAGPIDVSFNELNVGNNSWALFTQNDFKFNDVFSITAGGRYTEERLNQDVAFSLHSLTPSAPVFICQAGPNKGTATVNESACAVHQSAKFSGTSYLLSFNFQFTPGTLFYVKTARGFRGGALQVRAPDLPAAAPEIATDYEIGLKTDLFDRRLRANLAVFQTNYDNKQETAIITQNGVQFTPILNAASARIRGFEGEFTAAPIRGLTLNANFGYLDTQYLSYPNALTRFGTVVDASGLPFGATFSAPKWTYNLGGRYVMDLGPGQVGVSANYAWTGKTAVTPLNRDPALPQSLIDEFAAAHGLLNASLDYTLADQGLTFSVFATNLTNETYRNYALTFAGAPFPYGVTTTTQEPRMWGVSVRKTFGAE
ncbi:MAG: hypothetical protein JWQ97_581 [Phenylobacterium sp.]|nr:hypothetical protein [Phenylobacterium sp.]